MFHEAQMNERNCFITFTYDDDHCPEKINRIDPQQFLKRLRHHSDRPIRYFLTGEYGEKINRPHYHAILFGEDFLGGAYDISSSLYSNLILEGIWKQGSIGISPFTMGTALYTAGYVNKKISSIDTFSIMSRTPPLGKTWVRKHKDNFRRLELIQIEGKFYPIPPVYLNWLEGVEEYDHIKSNRAAKTVTHTDQQLRALSLVYKKYKAHT